MNVVSFGGGSNSAAMVIGMWQKGIPIDLILFADTGAEKPWTYQFIETFNRWLAERGLPGITTVRRTTKEGDIETLEQELLRLGNLPSPAYGRRNSCSQKYKTVPQEKYCAGHPGCAAVWAAGGMVDKYIGYDAGETGRMEASERYKDEKYRKHYPLIEWGWNREKCVQAIQEQGLPSPGKSSCYFCPNNTEEEIRELRREYPKLYQRAIEIERKAQKKLRGGQIAGLGREWKWEWLEEMDRTQLMLKEQGGNVLCESYIGYLEKEACSSAAQ